MAKHIAFPHIAFKHVYSTFKIMDLWEFGDIKIFSER